MKKELRKHYAGLDKEKFKFTKRGNVKLVDKKIYSNSLDKNELLHFSDNHFKDLPSMNGYKDLYCGMNAINHLVGSNVITKDMLMSVKGNDSTKGKLFHIVVLNIYKYVYIYIIRN